MGSSGNTTVGVAALPRLRSGSWMRTWGAETVREPPPQVSVALLVRDTPDWFSTLSSTTTV